MNPLRPLALGAALLMPLSAQGATFTCRRLDGGTFRSADVVGKKILVVDFWATWCAPCLKTLKHLQALQDSRPDLQVLAVSIDDAATRAKVGQYIQGKGYTFTVLLDPESALLRTFQPSMDVPFTFVLDRQGRVAYSHSGYVPGDEQALLAALDRLK